MTLVIRRVTPEEHELVGDLLVRGYDHNGYLVLPDGSYDEEYAAELAASARRDSEAEIWVADEDGNVLGCVTWCPPGSPQRQLAVKDSQGEFRGLAVDPSARGKGVGSALVAHCLQRARDDGLKEVLLFSLPDMEQAHRIYESFGFCRRRQLDWSPLAGVILWAFSTST